MQTVDSEQVHDECNGCQAVTALEDALDRCLLAGMDRDGISEVIEDRLWKFAMLRMFVGVGACITDGWPLANILKTVKKQHAYMTERLGKEPEVIQARNASLPRKAA
jgi:hypothetical protein